MSKMQKDSCMSILTSQSILINYLINWNISLKNIKAHNQTSSRFLYIVFEATAETSGYEKYEVKKRVVSSLRCTLSDSIFAKRVGNSKFTPIGTLK